MTPVSLSELQQIQTDAVSAACDQVCYIYRKTLVKDAYGTATETWVLHATVNAGMNRPGAGDLQNYDYIIGDKAAWTVLFPISTDVAHQDHLIIQGQVLVVQVVLTPRSYPALLAVIASETK